MIGYFYLKLTAISLKFYFFPLFSCGKGRGTVVTGRIEQGTIKTGEEVEVLGLRQVYLTH